MKKRLRLMICLVVLTTAMVVSGCSSADSETKKSEEETIIENCRAYINETEWIQKDKIDYSKYFIRPFKDWDLEVEDVQRNDNQTKVEENDLVVTVGETAQHDFAILLVDPETLKVKGYIPIK